MENSVSQRATELMEATQAQAQYAHRELELGHSHEFFIWSFIGVTYANDAR